MRGTFRRLSQPGTPAPAGRLLGGAKLTLKHIERQHLVAAMLAVTGTKQGVFIMHMRNALAVFRNPEDFRLLLHAKAHTPVENIP